MAEGDIASWLAVLKEAKTFEDAATATLRAMLDRANKALFASKYGMRGRLLRAMVHLRPEDGYRQLVVLHEGTARVAPVRLEDLSEGPGSSTYLPSATAWRWVAEHQSAVAIDVTLGKVWPHVAGGSTVVREKGRSGASFDSRESAQRLLRRGASHLYILPLRMPGATLDGMISLEAECRAAVGTEFIWPACTADLHVLADIAAPYLSLLPLTPVLATEPDEFLPVIGASVAGLIQMVRVFAEQDETILIGGPTGAGKSRLARWCHEKSRRKMHPFEALDLMTVPEDLQMGELFGWKKGAFSGAVTDNPGCIHRAERGTLFIDEIDKLSLKAQAGLLHVLEERSYRQLGDGTGTRKADVRFIIGTNANLQELVKSGRFREDLYYRINVLPIKVPPLEERLDEIPLWAAYMVNRRHRDSVPEGQARLSAEAERLLVATRWPGNLRQLDNIIRRAYALALLEYGGLRQEVVLKESHFERALAYEGDAATGSVIECLQRAAAAFVAEGERRAAEGSVLDLDMADVFRGFILAVAARKLGSREAAFELLGKESVVHNRNHQKAFRRELEKAAAFCRDIGPAGASIFSDLLADDEK